MCVLTRSFDGTSRIPIGLGLSHVQCFLHGLNDPYKIFLSFFLSYIEREYIKHGSFPLREAFGRMTWKSAHPIGVLLADGFRYLPDGFVFRILLKGS